MNNSEINIRLDRIETLLLSRKEVLNFDEIANFTGLSKSHLYKLTSTGGIPCYKPMGKKIYFDRKEIEEWLLSNKKKSYSEIEAEAEDFLLNNSK